MSFHSTEAKVSKPCEILIKLGTTQNPGTYELEPQTGCIQTHMAQPNASPSTAGVTQGAGEGRGSSCHVPQPLLGEDQKSGTSVHCPLERACVQVQDYK